MNYGCLIISEKCVVTHIFLSVGFCGESRVEGNMSRVEGKMSRVEGKMSRVQKCRLHSGFVVSVSCQKARILGSFLHH